MSSYIVENVAALDILSSYGLLGYVFEFLGTAGTWADAVSKLIGLVA